MAKGGPSVRSLSTCALTLKSRASEHQQTRTASEQRLGHGTARLSVRYMPKLRSAARRSLAFHASRHGRWPNRHEGFRRHSGIRGRHDVRRPLDAVLHEARGQVLSMYSHPSRERVVGCAPNGRKEMVCACTPPPNAPSGGWIYWLLDCLLLRLRRRRVDDPPRRDYASGAMGQQPGKPRRGKARLSRAPPRFPCPSPAISIKSDDDFNGQPHANECKASAAGVGAAESAGRGKAFVTSAARQGDCQASSRLMVVCRPVLHNYEPFVGL